MFFGFVFFWKTNLFDFPIYLICIIFKSNPFFPTLQFLNVSNTDGCSFSLLTNTALLVWSLRHVQHVFSWPQKNVSQIFSLPTQCQCHVMAFSRRTDADPWTVGNWTLWEESEVKVAEFATVCCVTRVWFSFAVALGPPSFFHDGTEKQANINFNVLVRHDVHLIQKKVNFFSQSCWFKHSFKPSKRDQP